MKIRYLIALLLILLVSACEYEDSDINYNMGNDFINDPTSVTKIDTLTVKTYTTTIDSFVTSKAKRFLSGKVVHPYGGETYCETYFRFDPCDEFDFDDTAVYDSIRLILQPDGYNAGDTTSIGKFEIFRLTEAIVTDDDDDNNYIYNTTQFDSEEDPMASFSVDLTEGLDNFGSGLDSVVVDLSDVLGQKLYDLIDIKSDTISDDEDFKKYFKGIVIRPVENECNFVCGFQANIDSLNAPRIRLYYHERGEQYGQYLEFHLEKEFDGYTDNTFTTNYIRNDYDASLENMAIDDSHDDTYEQKYSSTLSNNMSFIQGPLLTTRIEIPYIDNLNALGIGSIIKTELHIEPIEGTYDESEDLFDYLSFTLVDEDNDYYDALYSAGTTTAVYGYLFYDSRFADETYYTIDVTNFVKTEYEDEGIPIYSIMMSSPYSYDYPDVDRMVIGDQYSENELELTVYLTNFNEF